PLSILGTWFHFFFSSRRRHTRFSRDWSSDVALPINGPAVTNVHTRSRGGLQGGRPPLGHRSLPTSFLASSAQRTREARPVAISHWVQLRGVVPKAWLRIGTWTTTTCRRVERAMAPHNSGLVKRWLKALVWAARAWKVVK